MKSESEIAHKLKQVQFRHAKREIEALLAVTPFNCAHNRQLDVAAFGKIGFCSSTECPKKGKTCDARLHDRASSCSYYEALHTPDDARARVKDFFKNASPAEIAAKYSDAAALIWVLDDARVEHPDPYQAGVVSGVPIWVSDPELVGVVSEGLTRIPEQTVTPAPPNPPDFGAALRSMAEHQASVEEQLQGIRSQLGRPSRQNSVYALLMGLWLVFSGLWRKP